MFFGAIRGIGHPTSPAHLGGATLRPPDARASLLGLYPTGRRTSQIPDLRPRPASGRAGLVFGPTPSGSARPFYRLVGLATSGRHPPVGLYHTLPHSALGEGAPLGQSLAKSGGAADRR